MGVGFQHIQECIAVLSAINLQEDVLMRLPEVRLQVIYQRLEHGAVHHVVAIQNQILALCLGSVPTIQERGSTAGGIAVEIPAQVMFRVIWRVHDRVVDPRVWDGKPPHAIGIFRCQGCQVVARRGGGQGHRFSRLTGIFSGRTVFSRRSGFGRWRALQHKFLRKSFVGFFLLSGVNEVMHQPKAAARHGDDQGKCD